MIDTVPRPDATLPEFLAARARHASDARLAAYACGGFVVLVAVLVWRGPAWHVLASLAGCVLAFGVWGIADRELGERSGANAGEARTLLVLRAVRVTAAILGAIAFAALLVSAMAIALGRMIS